MANTTPFGKVLHQKVNTYIHQGNTDTQLTLPKLKPNNGKEDGHRAHRPRPNRTEHLRAGQKHQNKLDQRTLHPWRLGDRQVDSRS